MRTKWWSGALAAVTAGAVSELTLAEVKRLRLKVGLGGSQAPLTDERVPTLAEAMAVVKGRAMVNLDKAWDIRDDVYDVLVETDTLDHGCPGLDQHAVVWPGRRLHGRVVAA